MATYQGRRSDVLAAALPQNLQLLAHGVSSSRLVIVGPATAPCSRPQPVEVDLVPQRVHPVPETVVVERPQLAVAASRSIGARSKTVASPSM